MLSCIITLPLLTKITPIMHNKLTVFSNHYKNKEKEKQNNGQEVTLEMITSLPAIFICKLIFSACMPVDGPQPAEHSSWPTWK